MLKLRYEFQFIFCVAVIKDSLDNNKDKTASSEMWMDKWPYELVFGLLSRAQI
jgi:hypothetical protein